MPHNNYFVIPHSVEPVIFVLGFKNNYGQLGLGHKNGIKEVTQIRTNPSRFTSVVAGEDHTVALAEDGQLWVWGNNGNSEIGLGYGVYSVTVPHQLINPNRFVFVACGGRTTFALDSNGIAWACGWNGYGQLGIGGTTRAEFLSQVQMPIPVKKLSAGTRMSVFIDVHGNVWACGDNDFGNLGIGTTDTWQCLPQQLTSVSQILDVSCGSTHTLLLHSDGSVWCFGTENNQNGALGLGTDIHSTNLPVCIPNTNQITNVWCGFYSSYIRNSDGQVFVFGDNSSKQLGFSEPKTLCTPTENELFFNKCLIPGAAHVLAVDALGGVELFGILHKKLKPPSPLGINVGPSIPGLITKSARSTIQ